MINRIHIKGFKNFRDLEVKHLRRVNILTGKNNVGKTGFLEAVWLAHGMELASIVVRSMELRGFNQFSTHGDQPWSGLFFDLDTRREAEIETVDDGETLVHRLSLPDDFSRQGGSSGNGFSRRLMGSIESSEREGRVISFGYFESLPREPARLITSAHPQHMVRAPWHLRRKLHYLSGNESPHNEIAGLFNDHVREKTEGRVVDVLRDVIEPRIRDLYFVMDVGPLVLADVGLSQRIPLQQVGDGTSLLLRNLLAIEDKGTTAVCIDEVESGLHHEVMPKVWSALHERAKARDVQIFATTHSWECIQAAAHGVPREDLLVLKLLDHPEEGIWAAPYNDEDLEYGLKRGFELR